MSTQPLKVSTRDSSWGKGGRGVRLTTFHPCSAEMSRKSGALTYPETLGPPRPVAGDLYFLPFLPTYFTYFAYFTYLLACLLLYLLTYLLAYLLYLLAYLLIAYLLTSLLIYFLTYFTYLLTC